MSPNSIMSKNKNNLKGLQILLTRSPADNLLLSEVLKSLGAKPLSCPSFDFRFLKLSKLAKKELQSIHHYDWLVFTSPRAVQAFVKQFFKVHQDYRVLMTVKIAAVGFETAKLLWEHKLWVDLLPKVKSSSGLAEEKLFKTRKKLKIYMPCAEDAKKDFQELLPKWHKVIQRFYYKKVFLQASTGQIKAIKKTKVDWVLFYSPSAVHGFLKNFGRDSGLKFLTNCKVATLGKTTSKALIQLGVPPEITSMSPKTNLLLKKIAGFKES